MVDRFFREELEELERRQLMRMPDDGAARGAAARCAAELGVPLVDASSNDYLGLAARHGVSRETLKAWEGLAAGSGASRLIHGTRAPHRALEAELAAWVGMPAALLFSSGYAANVGLVAALGVPGTLILSDALNHASLIDGARLSRAAVRVVPHLDLGALESELKRATARQVWVVTESYFSMDGDGPDLLALRAVCDRFGAGLVVDEAHALGVFGPSGAGRCAEVGIVPDVLVGTLGKAVGVHGAFVAGSNDLRRYLWNRARSFVFSTAPSPHLAQLGVLHVKQVREADGLRATLLQRSERLRALVTGAGLTVPPGSFGPIVPVVVGENDAVQEAAAALGRQGILVQGIRPPTVPPGTARLRVTVSAAMGEADVERLGRALAELPRAHAGTAPTRSRSEPKRIVVLGTGTGIGKTHVSVLLTRRLRELGHEVLALKPIESGSPTVTGPDAAALAAAAGREPASGSWTFPDALSPHLAARRTGRSIATRAVRTWVEQVIAAPGEPRATHVTIESAGGVFSPLSESETNFDLALALEPAFWVLVAPDALGVLHELTATLAAMGARGRRPDAVVLSAARPADSSTGLNAPELAHLGITTPLGVVGRDEDAQLEALLAAIARY